VIASLLGLHVMSFVTVVDVIITVNQLRVEKQFHKLLNEILRLLSQRSMLLESQELRYKIQMN